MQPQMADLDEALPLGCILGDIDQVNSQYI